MLVINGNFMCVFKVQVVQAAWRAQAAGLCPEAWGNEHLDV